jgi:peroxiredoxin
MIATAPTALRAGDAAPDLTLPAPDASFARLSDLWHAAPRALALVFVRHWG